VKNQIATKDRNPGFGSQPSISQDVFKYRRIEFTITLPLKKILKAHEVHGNEDKQGQSQEILIKA